MPTDLPEPVVPATSRCGMRARSATTGWPPMSLPSASASGECDLVVGLGADDLAERDDLALLVGDLQAHDVLARDRLDHAHADSTDSARARSFASVDDLARLDARARAASRSA